MWQTAGHNKLTNLLRESISRGSLAHAYLFTGPSHIGKMTLALDLARALNCRDADSPCGKCRVCERIEQGKHPDVIVIDKNSGRDVKDKRKSIEISIDCIRDILQKSANLPPYEGKYKVFIIDNADLLSTEAANCVLKSLEEPPPHIVIILLTTQERNLLPTVISRCQKLELKPVKISTIEEFLSPFEKENSEKVHILARLCNGCIGWALSSLKDDALVNNRRHRYKEFAALLSSGWTERLSYIEQLNLERSNLEDTLNFWISWCHDVLILKYDCESDVINVDCLPDLKLWAQSLTVIEISDFIEALVKAQSHLTANANPHLLFEVLMLDLPKKERRAEQIFNTVGLNI